MVSKYLHFMFIALVVWIDSQSASIGAEDAFEPKFCKVVGSRALSKILAVLEREGYHAELLAGEAGMEKLFNECLPKNEHICYYHGSPNKELDVLEPQSKTIRSVQEGAVVFASPCPELASCFLFEHDDSWTNLSIGYYFDQGVLRYTVSMVIGDRDRFNQQDRGGSLYCLPTSKFVFNRNLGLRLNECTSKEPVKPLRKEDFARAFDAMTHYGVQISFLTKEQFEVYKTIPFDQKPRFLERYQG